MSRFITEPNGTPTISNIRYNNTAESSRFVDSIAISDTTALDSSLASFLKLKGSTAAYAEKFLTIRQQLETFQGGGEDPAEKQEVETIINDMVTKQYIQTFFDAYMAPGGKSDIIYRLGEVLSKADVKNAPYIGNNKLQEVYTPTNMELNFNLRGGGFTGGTVKYFNNLFPPYTNTNFTSNSGSTDKYEAKSSDQWVWDNNGNTFVLQEGTTGPAPKFDSNKLTSKRDLTFRGLSFKGVNDNISLLQKVLEGATGIISTYMTEWDISLYCQEKIVSKQSIPCITMNIKADNPSNYYDERAYSYGQLNAAVSKISDTDVAINDKFWQPENYPLSCYWTSYGDVRGGILKDVDIILKTASQGYTGTGLNLFGFSKDKFSSLPFHEKVKFLDYQGAAYSGWVTFDNLRNYQLLYTTKEDEESELDILHLQAQTKDFGWVKSGKFENICTALEEFHLQTKPTYGTTTPTVTDDFVYVGIENGYKKYYKAYKLADKEGILKTAFGKMQWRDKNNGRVIKEEWVADMNGASLSFSTLKADTVLQLVNYIEDAKIQVANNWATFLKGSLKSAPNGKKYGEWGDGMKELWSQQDFAKEWDSTWKSFGEQFSGAWKSTDETFPSMGVGALIAMPRVRQFPTETPATTPETSKHQQPQSSVSFASAVMGDSENMKNAPQNGVSQLAPALHGGPHGKSAAPNSLQAYFDSFNQPLRNIPRITDEGVVDNDYKFVYGGNEYNTGINGLYGSSTGLRSPAAALNMLKAGFFEPANYLVKVKGYYPIEVGFSAHSKTVSAAEYNSLRASHPGLSGTSKNYGKQYTITYYTPSATTAGVFNSSIIFDPGTPSVAYTISELYGAAAKKTPVGTGCYSSSTTPSSKAECFRIRDGQMSRSYPGGSYEYLAYIRYSNDNSYYVRNNVKIAGITPTSLNGNTSEGFQLMRYSDTPVAKGQVLDERLQLYKEPLIMSEFNDGNPWQISKIYTYDISKNNIFQAFADNFMRLLKGKAKAKGHFKQGDQHTHYILQIKGSKGDNSSYTEVVADENGNNFTRTKAFSTSLYCTDKEMQFRKMIFGDNLNIWKHPLFFVSKDNKNPKLDNTVEIIQLPCRIASYDYIQQDVSTGSCGRKTVTTQKKQGTFIEVDIEQKLDMDFWGNESTPSKQIKFTGLDISKTAYAPQADNRTSWSSITKNVDELIPSDSKNIADFLELEDTVVADASQTTNSAPCGPALVAGLRDNDITEIQSQKWYAGVGFTTYLPGLKPDISSINSNTIKKIVSLDELAPFTINTTYDDTYRYFTTNLPKCKKYHLEEPAKRQGFSDHLIQYKFIKASDERIRPPKQNERSYPLYDVAPKLYTVNNGKIYFNSGIVPLLSSLKDLFIAEDTVNNREPGTTCKNKLDDFVALFTGVSTNVTQDSLFNKVYSALSPEYKVKRVYYQETVSDKESTFIAYDNSQMEDDACVISQSQEYKRYVLMTKLEKDVEYVDKIEEKTALDISFTLPDGTVISEDFKQFEYSYDEVFTHAPIDIYVYRLEENAFKYSNGEYEPDEQGIPSQRKFSKELYYSDHDGNNGILGTRTTKTEYATTAIFNASQVEQYSKETAAIRKEAAKSAYYNKFGTIFVDDYTKARPLTTQTNGGYSFPNRGTPSWTYQYAAFTIFAPKNAKAIVDGGLSLDATEFKPADINIHRKLTKLFFQCYCAVPFIKEYENASVGHIPTDNITPFNVLYKTLAIQSNWIGIAKKFYVDLLNFDSAKLIIENGVGKDILEKTLPALVGKDALTDDDRDNVKYRYWIERAYNYFSAPKSAIEKYFTDSKNKIDSLLKDRYGQLANRASINDLTPYEFENLFGWVRKCREFLVDSNYQQMGEYMMSYLNVLYELRKYYINMRCNKVNGTLWTLRHIESSIPLVKDVTQTDNSGIKQLENGLGDDVPAYNVVSKEVTNDSDLIIGAILSDKQLAQNQISHIYLRVEYVDDARTIKDFITTINQPDFKPTDIKKGDNVYVFLPHNARFAKLPITDKYTLTSGDYYAEKAKFLTSKPLSENFKKPDGNGQLGSDLLEFTWDIKWNWTDFKTIGEILALERYANDSEAIESYLRGAFGDDYDANLKIFYYDNTFNDNAANMNDQKNPSTPIIVWNISDSINLKNIVTATAAFEDGAVDPTSYFCATGKKSDFWRIKVQENVRLPYADDFADNCMIEAISSTTQVINYNETLTTVLGPFAYSAYPIDEKQDNSQLLDIMSSMGVSAFMPEEQ